MLFPCPRCSSRAKVTLRPVVGGSWEFVCLSCGWNLEDDSPRQAKQGLAIAYHRRVWADRLMRRLA